MKTTFFLVLAILIGLTACESEPGYKKTDSGLKYKFYEETEGPTAEVGDWVTISMDYGKKDSLIFSTDVAEGGKTSFPVQESQFQGDVFEALTMMSIGDSAQFVVSADSFFLVTARSRQLPPFIESGSDLYFDIKMLDIETEEEHQQAEAERLAELELADEQALLTYVEENKLEKMKTEEGIYFIRGKRGSGPQVDSGKMVKLHLSISSLDGEKIFSTRDQGEPAIFQFGKQFDTRGLDYGVQKMRKGGTAEIVVPSELAWGAKGRGQVLPPYTSLHYDVEIVDIIDRDVYQKQQEEEKKIQEMAREKEAEERKNAEPAKISAYIKANNIEAEPTESGLYFIPLEEGTGSKPLPGDKVTVHYTLYTLEGSKLQSSKDAGQPFEFTLGKGEVIPGWDEGIPMMKEGGKAKFLIPSDLAYGERSMGGGIEPYTPLLFQVELLEVKPANE